MLVATPGQTTAYSTLHNSGGSTTTASTSTKKTTTLNSSNTPASGTPKSLNNNSSNNNNNNHTTTSSINTTKHSVNSNTHPTPFNCHQIISKNDNNTGTNTKLNNNSNSKIGIVTPSSRKFITPTVAAVKTHSLKSDDSTNATTVTTTKQSFIQTLKDSVQKALISTTGRSSITSVAKQNVTEHKLQNNCSTSTQNVTSTSLSTSHNANRVPTTTSSFTLSNLTTATQSSSSSSSLSLVRNKYSSCSLSKLHTIAPTLIHRYPEERQKASSTDSLQKEMCHFKPIRIAPTTPWKSGSKSRGNSLRFPKANHATKNNEFILKSNCDVNNRKKKQQQTRTQDDKLDGDDDDADNNEQENREYYGIYKPKPSLTCLSTSITTPNHQSAFVCLITQMKNLVNIQSQKLATTSDKSVVSAAEDTATNLEIPKTKSTRTLRTSTAAASSNNPQTPTKNPKSTISEPIKELYVRKKSKPANKLSQIKEFVLAKHLPKSRSARVTSNANSKTTKSTTNKKSKEIIKRTNAKTNKISKLSTVAVTKVKSRKKLVTTKSKVINIVKLAGTKSKGKLQTSVSVPATNGPLIKTRKRKFSYGDVADLPTDATTQNAFLSTPQCTTVSVNSIVNVRKSSRLSKDMRTISSTPFFKQPNVTNQRQPNANTSQKLRQNPTVAENISPPLTRARLKQLAAQGKIVSIAPTEIKNRRI